MKICSELINGNNSIAYIIHESKCNWIRSRRNLTRDGLDIFHSIKLGINDIN